MSEKLIGKIGDLLHRRPWYALPQLLASVRLMEIRNELRQKNLHDTEEPPSHEKRFRLISIGDYGRSARSTARITISITRRWEVAADALAATFPSSMCFPIPRTCSRRVLGLSVAS